jgi:RNA polymerase sigma-70 factor (ECF subfamily)
MISKNRVQPVSNQAGPTEESGFLPKEPQDPLVTNLSVSRFDQHTENPDIECIDRIVCDDMQAFKQLFERYYHQLYFYARKHVRSQEACKDILQDVFSYLWEKRHHLEINQSVKAYLHRAVHYRCINYLKKENLDYLHLNHFHLRQSFMEGFQQDAHHQLQEKELFENIERIIGALPEQCRKIFRLSRENGLKHKEIASKLSISTKTVEVQIYRALKYLKQNLEEENNRHTIKKNNDRNK